MKRVLAGWLALVMAVAFVGCGESKTADDGQTTTTTTTATQNETQLNGDSDKDIVLEDDAVKTSDKGKTTTTAPSTTTKSTTATVNTPTTAKPTPPQTKPVLSVAEAEACVDIRWLSDRNYREEGDVEEGFFRLQYDVGLVSLKAAKYQVKDIDVIGATLDGKACTIYQPTSDAKVQAAAENSMVLGDYMTLAEAMEGQGWAAVHTVARIVSPAVRDDWDNPVPFVVTVRVTFQNGAVTDVVYRGVQHSGVGGPGGFQWSDFED